MWLPLPCGSGNCVSKHIMYGFASLFAPNRLILFSGNLDMFSEKHNTYNGYYSGIPLVTRGNKLQGLNTKPAQQQEKKDSSNFKQTILLHQLTS